MVKKSVSSPTENKENTSPGSCRSPGNLDLDFPIIEDISVVPDQPSLTIKVAV
jgi:hypothetical protein